MDFSQLTIKKAVTDIKSGTLDPVDLLTHYIDIIEQDNKSDKPLNAVISLNKDAALKVAASVDKKLPLGGLPVLVKDNFNVEGHSVGCASNILSGYVSPFDGGVAERLKAAGAVIYGRTNMDEFAMGSTTEHSAYGLTRNPVNRDYVPGGSSGGAASSVGGGQSISSLGSDTGGSIRQPAALCGVVGLKPTYGRVSRYGLVAFGSSLDQIGPICKTVEDCAIMLNIIAGYDHRDSTSVDMAVPDYTAQLNNSLKGVKIGLPKEYFTDGLDGEIKKNIDSVVDFYKKQGAIIKEITLPSTEYAVGTYYIISTAEASANLARFDGIRYGRRSSKANNLQEIYFKSRSEGFGDEVKRRIMLGTYVLSSGYYDAYYLKAQKVRRIIKEDFEKSFNDVDVILTPAVPESVSKLGENSDDPVKMYLLDIFTTAANLAGVPAMTLPSGRDKAGLPLSFQLMAPHFGEERLLNVANIYNNENKF